MRGGRIDRETMNQRAAEQLHRLGLDVLPTTLVRTLRVAAQQQVEIAKALTLKIASFAVGAIKRLGVKGQPGQAMRFLSGGNQQKAIIARWISRSPKVFILDEPTRGIDMGARAAIYETIAGLAREGMAVVVVSSDLEEVIGLAHRVIVLARGRLQGTLKQGDATNVAIMELATR